MFWSYLRQSLMPPSLIGQFKTLGFSTLFWRDPDQYVGELFVFVRDDISAKHLPSESSPRSGA